MNEIRKDQEKKLWNAVKDVSDEQIASKIVYGANREAEKEDDVNWVKSTMERLETTFNKEKVKEIRMNCQCGYGIEERVVGLKQVIEKVNSMEEFAEMTKDSGLSCKDGELYLQFPMCTCPIVQKVDHFDKDTWCLCTTGYSKVLFEQAFECEVDVELLKSVKMGDDICLMKIIPSKAIWK